MRYFGLILIFALSMFGGFVTLQTTVTVSAAERPIYEVFDYGIFSYTPDTLYTYDVPAVRVLGFSTYGLANQPEFLIIPDEINGMIVKEIGAITGTDNSFKQSTSKYIKITGNANFIERSAFNNSQAEIVYFDDGDGELAIQNSAFGSMLNLKTIIMGNTVREISSGSFPSCRTLTTLVLGSNLRTIGTGCFSNCRNLACLVIPPSVENISGYAFQSGGIRDIIVEEGDTELIINGGAMNNLKSLVNIYSARSLDFNANNTNATNVFALDTLSGQVSVNGVVATIYKNATWFETLNLSRALLDDTAGKVRALFDLNEQIDDLIEIIDQSSDVSNTIIDLENQIRDLQELLESVPQEIERIVEIEKIVEQTVYVKANPNPAMMIVGSVSTVIGLGALGGGATMFVIARRAHLTS